MARRRVPKRRTKGPRKNNRRYNPKRNRKFRPKRKPASLGTRINRFFRRHLIFTGIFLIAVGIIIWRLSLALNFFKQYEVIMWAWLVAGAFVLAGILVLLALWRNNVSMLTTKHNVNWKNR